MGFVIPIINRDLKETWGLIQTKAKEETAQKKLALLIASIALFMDNMLFMVIVPIMTSYLRSIGTFEVEWRGARNETMPNGTVFFNTTGAEKIYLGENEMIGNLFASKAIIQVLVNPISGTMIDRYGYEYPLMFGLCGLFVSTSMFAFADSYGTLYFARAMQGLGSAFADTSSMALVVDRYTEDFERKKALGIALSFISLGTLVAPPFGGLLYDFAGKPVPFILLALVCLADAILVMSVIHPKIRRTETGEKLQGTPIWRLLMDPYIAVCSGALIVANASLAFLEPTMGGWMTNTMKGIDEWEIGIVWLPSFFPYIAGIYVTIWGMKRFPELPWLIAAIGCALDGVACFGIPFCRTFVAVMFPLAILCFGCAMVDTAVMPLLAFLVDKRYVSVYGSVYAIADISYNISYAIGPMIAGAMVAKLGFMGLSLGICLLSLAYAPVLSLLRKVCTQYKSFEGDQTELGMIKDGRKGAPTNEYGSYQQDGYGSAGILDDSTKIDGYGYENPTATFPSAANDYFPAASMGESYAHFPQQQQKPKVDVEWKDTIYNRKVKPKKAYKGAYKDSQPILDDEEDQD